MNKAIDVSAVVLETERLTLRAFRPEDLEDLFEYASVDGVGQMAGWQPHRNKEESSRILKSFIDGRHTFALVHEGKVIGSVGVDEYNDAYLSEFGDRPGRELGYVLAKPYWGQGLMPEAVGAVIRYLFDAEGLEFLISAHFSDNLRSMRVQQKCGFVHYRKVRLSTQDGERKEGWLSLLERQGMKAT